MAKRSIKALAISNIKKGQLDEDRHLFGAGVDVVFDVAVEDLLPSVFPNLKDLVRVVVEDGHLGQEGLQLDLGGDRSGSQLVDGTNKGPT